VWPTPAETECASAQAPVSIAPSSPFSQKALGDLANGSIGRWTAGPTTGRNGFVYADYLTTARNPSTPGNDSGVGNTTIAAGSNARVTDTLNFRSSPSYSAGVIGIAAVGTVVRVTGAASSGFYPVKWGESTGYMHRDYLVYTTEALSTTGPNGGVGGNTGGGPGAGSGPGSTTGQSLVSYAMRYLGYPYIWATHGPNSFDCSGFTYWVVLNVTGRDIGAGTGRNGKPAPPSRTAASNPVIWSSSRIPTRSVSRMSVCTSATTSSSTPKTKTPESGSAH